MIEPSVSHILCGAVTFPVLSRAEELHTIVDSKPFKPKHDMGFSYDHKLIKSYTRLYSALRSHPVLLGPPTRHSMIWYEKGLVLLDHRAAKA